MRDNIRVKSAGSFGKFRIAKTSEQDDKLALCHLKSIIIWSFYGNLEKEMAEFLLDLFLMIDTQDFIIYKSHCLLPREQ